MLADFLGSESAAYDFCRGTCCNAVPRDIVTDNGSSSNYRAPSDSGTGYNDGSMTYPNVVFNYNFEVIAARRVPYRLAYDVISVVIASHECNISSDEYVVPELGITVD
jgi:hypothetical protein